MTYLEYMDFWHNEPFIKDQTPNDLTNLIDELVKNLSQYFGLTRTTREEIEFLYSWFFIWVKENKLFKLCDMNRALYLYKDRPELNKLCPEYFEKIFNKYRQSDERKEIIKEYKKRIEQMDNQLAEKVQPTPEELLTRCFYRYLETKQIEYNTGAVFNQNAKLIENSIGTEKCKQIVENTKQRLIKEIEKEIENTLNKEKRSELFDELTMVENQTGRVKVEWRKMMLQTLFDNHLNGSKIIETLPKSK